MTNTPDQLTVRRAEEHELDAVIACCAEALGWDPDEPNADFFRWKHRENPFGPSPIWVATDADRIVGVRALMRWRLVRGDDVLEMVRAVDTATLPSHQGRGIFSRLTQVAVDELTAEGVAAVFNTPNDKSRPGYLKLGWVELGRVPVRVRVNNPLVLGRLVRSRVGAGKWGEPTPVGTKEADVDGFLDRWRPPAGWHTPLDRSVLEWRYGFEPLRYRYIDGAFFRVRRRGAVTELSICDVAGPALRLGALMKATGADVAIASGSDAVGGTVRVDRLGPRLTWRALAGHAVPTIDELSLGLGTIELF